MVSVIIPTYNGRHKIKGILNALEKQSYTDIEVVVVIDGSTDGTADEVRNLKTSLTSLQIVEQENRGRSTVRNRGAYEAKGDLLLFFDDDMLPLKDCVQKHVEHHHKFPNSILTGGLGEEVGRGSSEIMKFKSFLSNKWTSELQRDKEGQLSKTSIFITAANFSISKQLFLQLEGFDERLRDAEDFDFAVRAFKAHVPLYFNPQAFAWHNETVTTSHLIKRQRQYAKAHQALLHLKPWLEKEGFIRPAILPQNAKARIFRLFSNFFWIKLIDQNTLSILPQKLRYKLYDIIITANGVYYPEKVKLS